jgi:diacylglycerol kinase family enzyme
MSSTQRAAVIYYPGRVDRKKLVSAVEAITLPGGWEPTLWMATSDSETGGPQTLRALVQNATHILVSGGDGTIRGVAEALVISGRTDVTMGIVPSGTGNVLARNLGLELGNLQRAVTAGLTGKHYTVDVGRADLEFANGEVDQRFFTGIAGVGLDARIMQNTNPALKRRIGWVAYIEGGIKALPAKFDRLLVSVDGREPRRLKLHSLLVGNAGWLPGNISLMPDARLDDGILDVAAIGPRRFWNWIDFWSRVTWQNKVVRPLSLGRRWMDATANLKTFENLNGSHIHVVSEKPVDIQLDGDPLGKIVRVDFNAVPRALSVRV